MFDTSELRAHYVRTKWIVSRKPIFLVFMKTKPKNPEPGGRDTRKVPCNLTLRAWVNEKFIKIAEKDGLDRSQWLSQLIARMPEETNQ